MQQHPGMVGDGVLFFSGEGHPGIDHLKTGGDRRENVVDLACRVGGGGQAPVARGQQIQQRRVLGPGVETV